MRNFKSIILSASAIALALTSCAMDKKVSQTASGLNPEKFSATINGKQTSLYSMKNANGMEVCITNFGGRIVSICVPDKNGDMKDVVLGFDSVAQYADSIRNSSDFGAAIGRYANRINQGKINIAGKTIQLPKNNFGHCLHGGPQGWQYQVYEGKKVNDRQGVKFRQSDIQRFQTC